MSCTQPEELGSVDDYEQDRGIKVYRPYTGAVKAVHLAGWVLIAAGTTEAIIGALLFEEWGYVGCFWMGALAWTTGVVSTFVSESKNSGGPATAALFVLAGLSVTAATLSLRLVDGRAYVQVHYSKGNCFNADSCPDNTCGGKECVCWAPDNSTLCEDGTSTRYCFTYNKGQECNEIGDSEGLLLTSTILLLIVDAISCFTFIIATATICCWRRTVTLRRSNGINSVVRAAGADSHEHS